MRHSFFIRYLFPFFLDPASKLLCTKWTPHAVTVAGGHGYGRQRNQLNQCTSLYVDEDENVLIADSANHRIVEWKRGATSGQLIAGEKGEGSKMNQLSRPTAITVDRNKNSILICDSGNRRVVRWPRRQGQEGEIVISNIDCSGMAMDNEGFLYVTDIKNHEVRRYELKKYVISNFTRVAGGHGKGDGLNQLNHPSFVFVDQDHSVYVSDADNHRVMKWTRGAKKGIIVAGGKGVDNGFTQLHHPAGLFVNSSSTIYVVDSSNHRVMRWCDGRSDLIAGGNVEGKGEHQLSHPEGLSVDRHGNLYVADWRNHRIQRFSIIAN